jgi:hypothetical protein
MHVIYKLIPADEIFNGCDPSMLYDVVIRYKDRWWDAAQDELRAMLRATFIKEFDALTGHYTRLRASIKEHGLLNPIVVTAGAALWRPAWMLPKDYGEYLCESCGGSRLMIAQELGLDVPCVVNTRTDIGGEPLNNIRDVLGRFHDKSYSVEYGPPTRVQPTRFEHMPNSYRMREQMICRQSVHQKMVHLAKNWKPQNTKRYGT